MPLYPAVVNGRTYYRFKDPKTRKFVSLGSDLAAAKKAAGILMSRRQTDAVTRLVAKVDSPGATVSAAIADFSKALAGRINRHGAPLSESTLRDYANMLERYERHHGTRSIGGITHGEIADWLAPIPARQANMLRGLLVQLWTYAVARGWAEGNIVDKTLKVDAPKTRQRLLMPDYLEIRAAAPAWLAGAMDVALYSLQRREDVVDLPVSAWDAKAGVLVLEQGKTKKGLSITAGPQLRAAIELCLSLPPTSAKTIVRDGVGSLDPDDFTDAFAAARDSIERFAEMAPRTKPSVHEMRSLGAALFLWECRDLALVQALLGHETAKQTLEYLRGHRLPPEAVTAS
ncbi:tyrosine-type recombinase/integrase [Nevskia sp.]|uniref:tyrosine-type recombinase/integrase n=1 Tax=Nevskia sp. TaxID=1929292 RepID=UPI0025F44C5B|nr:tyrosine-type recombinase/integrase [Nevskia sp.]